jgi:hypothetical protein
MLGFVRQIRARSHQRPKSPWIGSLRRNPMQHDATCRSVFLAVLAVPWRLGEKPVRACYNTNMPTFQVGTPPAPYDVIVERGILERAARIPLDRCSPSQTTPYVDPHRWLKADR